VGVRFPWGSILALRCGSLSAPLDVASGGHLPACAIVAFVVGAFTATPAIRVVREEEGRRSYSRRQLQPIMIRCTAETGAFSSAEDADSPWAFSVLVEPSPRHVDL